jgi:DNA polymerase III alpha subunit (gram-positive type)
MTFIKSNWKYIVGLVVVLALLFWGRQEYQQWKQHIIDQAQKTNTQIVVTSPPQIINTKTETIREVSVQAPSQEGAILQFVERQGKVIAHSKRSRG